MNACSRNYEKDSEMESNYKTGRKNTWESKDNERLNILQTK